MHTHRELRLIPAREQVIALIGRRVHAGDAGTDRHRDPECKSNDLPDDQQVLESFVQLLPMPAYTRSLWDGLVTSIGGMSVSVVSLCHPFSP